MIVAEEMNKHPEVRFAADFEISKNAPFKTVDEFVAQMGNLINPDMFLYILPVHKYGLLNSTKS